MNELHQLFIPSDALPFFGILHLPGDASSAFPSVLSPLVWQYSIADISRIFPTKTLPLRAEAPQKARARAIGKYYEVSRART